ncbi:membrane protein [Vibrio fortis]|uniref:Outer-membrane lipoprotein LolB n=1 Tax=Vibrio fortis TaxID=212667 RepID=A0A066UYZ0_9VIBR|nr:lipoprotein insertase outer membrane protein LolB [Vibrio fortis]KDN29449.1 membrane protein [Vibrio fortis]
MDRFRKIASLIFFCLVVAGCVSVPEQPTSVEWQAHQRQLQEIQYYQATGKLAYISPEERQSLNFLWKHSPNFSQLRLTTFLGQTALNLTINKYGAKVVTYDDQVFNHRSASKLVKQLTGLTIPVDHLPQWLLGNPDEADTYLLNTNNTVEALSKQIDGKAWQLNFDRYRDVTLSQDIDNQNDTVEKVLPLPTRLSFKQDENKINIVVSKWTLGK